MNAAVNVQSTSSASSSLPSDAVYAMAAVTVTADVIASGSETQPTARCVLHSISAVVRTLLFSSNLFTCLRDSVQSN